MLALSRSLAHKGFAKCLDPPQTDLWFLYIVMYEDLSPYLKKKWLNFGKKKAFMRNSMKAF